MGIASDLVLIIVAGFLGALAARALRLPLMVGYVAAGVAIGPNTFGPTVAQAHDVERLAEIGVALLLFSLGLELSFRDLRPVRWVAFIGGPLQILITGAVAAIAAIRALHVPTAEALWFGAMLSVSSTIVVLKTLSSAGVTQTLASRVMIGLLVIQDLATVPMLVILPQIGATEDLVGKLARAVAVAIGLLGGVVLLGTWLLPKLLRLVLSWGSRELFLISVVAIGVGVGYASHLAGLSFALGAFVAGLVLSESEFSHQALSDVVPIRDIFGLVFFVSVGMLLEPSYLISHAGLIVAVVALTLVGKSVITGGLTRSFGYGNMAPWIVGIGLSQIGEFSFVLARTGLTSGMVSKPTYDLALASTVVTMGLSPITSRAALPLGRLWRRWRKPARPITPIQPIDESTTGHVIIAGYGRGGSAAARVLLRAGISVVGVEINHTLYGTLAADGLSGVWGDITSAEILKAAGIDRARVLMVTVPDQATVRLCVEQARRLNPAITIVARALRTTDATALHRAGADSVVQAEFEGGIAMVQRVLTQYNRDDAAASRLTTEIRAEFYEQLDQE